MDKIYVGIDISLDSTGITYIHPNDNVVYTSFLNVRKISGAKNPNASLLVKNDKLLSDISKLSNFSLKIYDRLPSAKKWTPSELNRAHMLFCSNVSKQMINEFISTKKIHGKELVINIENYSYGSAGGGSATFQIAEFTGILKAAIIDEDVCKMEDLHVIPGPSVKMLAGSGNYDKFDMLYAYRELKLTDPLAKYVDINFDNLYKEKTKGKGSTVKKDVPSPLSDIIDSYWIARFGKLKH